MQGKREKRPYVLSVVLRSRLAKGRYVVDKREINTLFANASYFSTLRQLLFVAGNIKQALVQYERILELMLSDQSETVDFKDGLHRDSSGGGSSEEDGPKDGSVAWQGPRDSEFDDPWVHDPSNDDNQKAGPMNDANRVARLGLSSGSTSGRRRQLPAGDDRDMVGTSTCKKALNCLSTPDFVSYLPHPLNCRRFVSTNYSSILNHGASLFRCQNSNEPTRWSWCSAIWERPWAKQGALETGRDGIGKL